MKVPQVFFIINNLLIFGIMAEYAAVGVEDLGFGNETDIMAVFINYR